MRRFRSLRYGHSAERQDSGTHSQSFSTVSLRHTRHSAAARVGKPRCFHQVMGNEQEASLIAKDLYGILGIDESVDTSKVKSMYAQQCR